jgi:3-methylcrotonyl-CoA carboxylase beta subunit
MVTLTSSIDPTSETFQANTAVYDGLLKTLRERQAWSMAGGGERMVTRHRERGKIPVRERIDLLLDPLSPFLELSPLAAWGLYDNAVPGAGLVTGIGTIRGVVCMVIANDATTKGGSFFKETIRKHVRAQDIAFESRLPVVYLVDCGGANLAQGDEVFRTRIISATRSTGNAGCRPRVSRRSRRCSASARPAAPTSRLCPTRSS